MTTTTAVLRCSHCCFPSSSGEKNEPLERRGRGRRQRRGYLTEARRVRGGRVRLKKEENNDTNTNNERTWGNKDCQSKKAKH